MPDIMIIYEKEKECKICNTGVPAEHSNSGKELENITKYEFLRLQVRKLWNVKAIVIPIAISALETSYLKDYLQQHVSS